MNRIVPERSLTLRRTSLGAEVADALRDLIGSGRLRTGDRLIETEVARMLGVSRGPVREAIKLLSAEGLVAYSPGLGACVAKLTVADMRVLVGLRIRMEEYALELAAPRIGEEDIAVLRHIAAAMEEVARRSDLRGSRALDMQFHRTIWGCSGSQRLTEILSLALSPLLVWQVTAAENWERFSSLHHGLIVDALARRDVEATKAAFKGHMKSAWGGIGIPELA